MTRSPIFAFLFLLSLPIAADAQYSSVNSVFAVSGAGYISVPYSRNFNGALNGYISIDAWVRPASLTSYMTIVGNDWQAGYWLGITPQGKIRFYPDGGISYDSPGSIPAGQWSHVAVSYNQFKTTLKFYINGVLNGTVTTQAPIGSTTTDLRIGADRQGATPAYYWSGELDEVRIWNDEINFAAAIGLLYRIPHAVYNGRLGKYLVAGWRLNGDGGGIAGQHDGTLVGTGSFTGATVPPHYDRICASFTNLSITAVIPDYFAVPSSAFNSLLQNYTIECWVKPGSNAGSSSYQTFVSKGSVYTNVWSYWLGLNKATGKVRFVPNGDFPNGLESNNVLPMNQWTHVAARFSGLGSTRTATLFFNGLPAGSKNYSNAASLNQFDMLIGRADPAGMPGDGYGFGGFLDEVRLWSAARTDAQIADNHRLELSGALSDLACSYHFDGDVLDATGHGAHGGHILASNSDVYYLDASDLPSLPSVQVITPNGGENWVIGTTRSVQWNATGLYNVRIELSRDGGATFGEVLAPSVPATPSVRNVTVTGPATSKAVVRVTTPTPTTVADESDAAFEISEPPPFLSAKPTSLVFTSSQNAPLLPLPRVIQLTNLGGQLLSWDAAPMYGTWMTVTPAAGTANVDSFTVSVTTTALAEGSYTDSIKIGGNAVNAPVYIPVTYRVTSQQVHTIAGRVTSGGFPLRAIAIVVTGPVSTTLYTDSAGAYKLESVPEGDYIVQPNSPFYDFTPPSRSYTPLVTDIPDADFVSMPKNGRMRFRYKEGWNLCSLPLIPTASDLTALFPDASPPAYYYVNDSGYVPTTMLAFGRAYWIRFTRTDSIEISGELQGSLSTTLRPDFGGWNMIGAPSGELAFGSMVQSPPGSILAIFEYDSDVGYYAPPGGIIRPGRGYFVKTLAAADIFLGAGTFAPVHSQEYFRLPNARLIAGEPPPPPFESLK